MFPWYKYLIVNLVFSHLGFWSGNLFLIAPFPDLCLLVPSYDIFACNVGMRPSLVTFTSRLLINQDRLEYMHAIKWITCGLRDFDSQ